MSEVTAAEKVRKHSVSVIIDEQLWRRLRIISIKGGTTASTLVAELVRVFVEAEEKKQ